MRKLSLVRGWREGKRNLTISKVCAVAPVDAGAGKHRWLVAVADLTEKKKKGRA